MGLARATQDQRQDLDPSPLWLRTEWAQQATGPDGDVKGTLPGAAGGKSQTLGSGAGRLHGRVSGEGGAGGDPCRPLSLHAARL